MFKCSECGTEYEIAPKYCDCGNDIFINVESEEDFEVQEIEDFEEEIETPKHRNLRKKSFSPVGMGIFAFCIILSLLVLFVIGNPKKDLVTQGTETEVHEKIEIPSVDSYWDNTAVEIAQKEEPQPQKEENILDKIVQQIAPAEQPKKETKTVTAIQPKKAVQTTQKTVQKPKVQTQKTAQTSKTQTAKPKQTTSKTPSNTANNQQVMTFGDLTNKIRNQYYQSQTQAQKQTQTAQNTPVKSAPIPQSVQSTTKTNSTQTQMTKAPVQTQTQTQTQTKPATTQNQVIARTPSKTQAQLKQELASYKSGLRNTIGRKIDFTRVIGDGECALSFKVNSNGRLISKAFTKQSSNITLNDAAFNALNTTTSYNPPPDGYKGETLRLTIKFYNGNFEISLN